MLTQKKRTNLRHEYKYLLSGGDYLQLKEVLKKIARLDLNSTDHNGYHIRSLYFDDVYDTAYHEKIMGFAQRSKYRIRIYNYSGRIIKLEEKVKFQDYIQKNFCDITKEEYFKIFDGDIGFLLNNNNSLKEKFYTASRNKILRPKIIADYLREAYFLPYNDIRITFDKHLSAAGAYRDIFSRDICSTRVGEEYDVILEVKFNNFLPSHMREILGLYSTSRLAVSKYILCRQFINRCY